MNRSTLVAILVTLALAAPGAALAPAAEGPPADLWRAAGVIPPVEPVEAPPVSLRDLAGRTVDLDDLRGRVVMLYFWATW